MSRIWSAEARNDYCVTVRCELPLGEEWYCLLRSDAHEDSTHAKGAMIRRHLDEAKDIDSPVFDFGDLFDAMQGRHDKRRSPDDLDPDHKVEAYFDRLVDDAIDRHRPYASQMVLLARGNHELSVRKHSNTDLSKRLSDALKREPDASLCHVGGFRGWVRFQFTRAGSEQRTSKTMYYSHSAAKGAMMSFGSLNVRRRGSYLPDADIVVTGNSHDEYRITLPRTRLSRDGIEKTDEVLHIQVPSYKDALTERTTGFEPEKEFPPKPVGAMWLKFWWQSSELKCDAIRAL